MADAARVHLDVELACTGDRIEGVVADGRGGVVEFSGWLELMSAFDRFCDRRGGDGNGSRVADRREIDPPAGGLDALDGHA